MRRTCKQGVKRQRGSESQLFKSINAASKVVYPAGRCSTRFKKAFINTGAKDAEGYTYTFIDAAPAPSAPAPAEAAAEVAPAEEQPAAAVAVAVAATLPLELSHFESSLHTFFALRAQWSTPT